MSLMTSDGTDRLGFLIHDAQRLMRKRFEARAADYGLSSAQWRLLARLVKDEGAPQARLAEYLEIEPISVSRLLDRMEAGGWITRRQDANDRRIRMIFPTDKSRAAFAVVKGIAGEVYEEALTGLSGDARRALIHGLIRIIENLSDGEAPSSEHAKVKGAVS
jgi:MarR family transcriptional regulator, transcriptional regulator for hemolysin